MVGQPYKKIWEEKNDPAQGAFLAEVVGLDCYAFQIAPYDERKSLSHYFNLEALKALQTQLNEYLEDK